MASVRKSVNTAMIRQLNVARIFHVLRLHPRATQRTLAREAGLDRATVSTVVTSLERDGLVVREIQPVEGRVGRPEARIHIPERAGYLLGARLEPTTIRLIAADLTGQPKGHLEVAGSTDFTGALDRLAAAVERLLEEAGIEAARVRGLGVGVPALMDADGMLRLAPNLGWRDEALLAALEDRFPMPVYADNDTKAAGLAEKLFGSCQAVRDFVLVSAHSGVGAALYLDGRLYRGRSGFAGELGHVKVRSDGRACACGSTGCLETYASESAILAQLAEQGRAFEGLRNVAAAAGRGDPEVVQVMHDVGVILGEACADAVNLLSPERIVLGGNLTIVAPYLLDAVRRTIAERSLAPAAARCEVVVSPLGVESVTMGGVALAMEGFLGLPAWLAASEIGAVPP